MTDRRYVLIAMCAW